MLSYNAIATVLFGGLVDRIGKNFNFLRDSLPRADVRIPFRTYLSAVFLNTIVAYMFSLVLFTILTTFLEIKTFHKILLIGYLPFMIALVAAAVMVLYPYQKMMGRKKNIDINLPFALAHMAAISESGVPPYMIFKPVSYTHLTLPTTPYV